MPSLGAVLPAARAGDAEAQYTLGVMYESGLGAPPDPAAAFDWYRKAEAQGHPGATFAIAEMYDSGESPQADPAMAFFWYLKAAQRGHPGGQLLVGSYYMIGMLVEDDYARAFLWLTLASRQGETTADELLEKLTPRMSAADHERARRLFEELGQPLP